MPRKNKKRCTQAINVTQKQKLMKLFEEASSDESDADEHCSDEELEESERSDDEREGSKHSENSSDSSNHDPFSDADGEYGSDANYEPGEDDIDDTSSNSDTSDSPKVSQLDSNSRKCVTKPMHSPDQQTSSTMIDCSTVIEVQTSSSKQTANQEHLNLLTTAIQIDCSPVRQTSILSQEQMEVQPNQSHVNTQEECSSPIQISSTQQPTIQIQSNQRVADTTILVVEVQDSISQETTSQDKPMQSAVSTPMDCSPVIQASSPSQNPTQEQQLNRFYIDIEVDSPDSQICSSQQREGSVQPVNQLECPQVAQSNSLQQRQPTPPANLENELNVGRPISSPTHVSSWEDTTLPITDFQFDHVSSGPTVPLNNNTTPINILEYFFTNEMLDLIVSCTNAYGTALCNSNRPHTRGSRAQVFKLTDREEMKKFLGLCILQGHLDVPSIRKLFTLIDPLYCHPIFPYVMSGRRFEQILRCLCISELNSKGIQKVKVFTAKVIRNFQTMNQPGKELSLDESLMPFRGRLSFRQYMKGKKAKYGIKFYVLTTNDGYILNFIIYEGKNTVIEGNEPYLEKLVIKLMEPYLNKGHELYMDNFYNSVSLSKKLLAYNTHTTGTLRKDRKENPKELFKKSLKSGEHAWQRNGKVYASIWKDKRPVFMITTKHHPRLVTTRNRFGKVKSKPVEIDDYNKHMSGIDRSDQMMSYYSTPKKTIRWYKKVFFRLLDMIIWNAFYLFKKHCDPKASLLGFRENIINSYIQVNENTMEEMLKKMFGKKHASRRRRRVNEGVAQVIQMIPEIGHWPELIPLRESSKRNKVFLKCRVCTKNKIVKQTSYRCKGCVGNPPLCPGCFELWHTDPIFRN